MILALPIATAVLVVSRGSTKNMNSHFHSEFSIFFEFLSAKIEFNLLFKFKTRTELDVLSIMKLML